MEDIITGMVGIMFCVNCFLIYWVLEINTKVDGQEGYSLYNTRKIHQLENEIRDLKGKEENAEEKVLLEINARALKKLYRKEKKKDETP